MNRTLLLVLAIAGLFGSGSALAAAGPVDERLLRPEFLKREHDFARLEAANGITTVAGKLAFRARKDPFLPCATAIFLCAILHTFIAVPISRRAHRARHKHEVRVRREAAARGETLHGPELVSFKATTLHFLGEIEAIFGIWVIVLLAVMCGFHGIAAVEGYMMAGVDFTEPLFVVIIMALASTRPVLRSAENCLRWLARLGRETPAAWWLSILIVAPVLGSLITEPAAMTIAAMLLARRFYRLHPSPRLAYGTLGLLFVNVSVGGVLTNFAAPPVLMVARAWSLTTPDMFLHFGLKSVIAIVLSTLLYFIVFRKELALLARRSNAHDAAASGDFKDENPRPIPRFVIFVHLGFMVWTVGFSHYPPLFIGGFLFFLAFLQATRHHQSDVALRGPVMVGFFLAGLVVHGGLQGWWLSPILKSLSEWPLFIGAVVLTSFNDNAAITYLASQATGLEASLKYAVLAGAITGGGLTVIANAPNPAGQSILGRFFGDGVSPVKLARAALAPTLIAAGVFMLAPDPRVDQIFATDPPPPPAPVSAAIENLTIPDCSNVYRID